MESKPMMIAVAATVVVIVIAAVLMPVLEDATTTDDKYTNTGVYYMSKVDSERTVVYVGTSGDISVDGETVLNRSDLNGNFWTIVSTPDYVIRLQNNSWNSYNLWLYGMGGTSKVLANNTYSATITITNDSITSVPSNSGSATTVSYTGDCYAIAKTGDYVMTNGTSKYILDSEKSIVIGNGITPIGGTDVLFYISGHLSDLNVETSTSETITNITNDGTAISGHKNGVELKDIVLTIDNNGTDVNATYNRIIVPYEVSLERSVHLDANENAILLVIPALLIIAILIGILIVAFRMRE